MEISIQEFTAREGLRVKWARGPQLLKYRIRIAVSWLLSVQAKEGFWDAQGPWFTSAVIQALMSAYQHIPEHAEDITEATRKAVRWLIQSGVMSKQPHDGLAWDPNLGTWDTAIVLRGLLAANYNNEEILDSIKRWLMNQSEENWFGATTVPFGESYPAQTFLALEEAGVTYYEISQIGKIFEKRQLTNGSWGKDHFNTAEVLLYLALHKEDNRNVINKAIDFIESTQAPNGSWSSWTWENAITLRAYLPHSTNPYNPTTSRALENLLGLQHENGSWFYMVADTAYVIQTLCFAVETLNFDRFEAFTDADFMVSRVSMLEAFSPQKDSNKETQTKSPEIQLSKRAYYLLIIIILAVILYFGFNLLRLLGDGWQQLTLIDRWNVVFNGIIELMAVIFASIIAVSKFEKIKDWFTKKNQQEITN